MYLLFTVRTKRRRVNSQAMPSVFSCENSLFDVECDAANSARAMTTACSVSSADRAGSEAAPRDGRRVRGLIRSFVGNSGVDGIISRAC